MSWLVRQVCPWLPLRGRDLPPSLLESSLPPSPEFPQMHENGQVLLRKGYGYADLKSKKQVDAETTNFRLASISKLFTWISVIQLVEQGKLDLAGLPG